MTDPTVRPKLGPKIRYGAPPVPETWSVEALESLPPYTEQPWPRELLGNVRGTGVVILLVVMTLGIYSLVWFYRVHAEMRRHSGEGLGGGLALVIAIFAGPVMPFVTSTEVGKLYERRGQAKPVSRMTGLWSFPGVLILVGPLVWFIKTNGALNAYWRSVGQR